MSLASRLSLGLKTLRELGLVQVGNYALYRLQLSSGYLRWRTQDDRRFIDYPDTCFRISPLLKLPDREELRATLMEEGCRVVLAEADEILAGRVRLFGGDPVPLNLGEASPKAHWTEYEKVSDVSHEKDIKWTWEMSRFGWATVLARAYWLTGDEKYPDFFWKSLEAFLEANLPYQGLQWTSGQEVALRVISMYFCAQVVAGSLHSTPERMVSLGKAIAAHAGRIPPGMAYARAQNNNHLLSEAAGLITAGLALREHPQAAGWRKLGWGEFHKGLSSQIADDGGYTQNSTNYHRLMLQLALWLAAISASWTVSAQTSDRLAAATHWLLDLLDEESGCVPNLGPNDGAYILPLTTNPFQDYRPTLQAAGRAFLVEAPLAAVNWDEMVLWLVGDRQKEIPGDSKESATKTIRLEHSWAYLRATRFSSRPGHADQLHVDLWWRGKNLALDPGTYLYNAAPPWDNALSQTCAHNTVTLNDQDQMTRTGRFLWLDWAQARLLEHGKSADGSWERITAEHDGYRGFGVLHWRSLTGYRDGHWRVEDKLLPQKKNTSKEYSVRLHWLLPDWPWTVNSTDQGAEILLVSPDGQVKLDVGVPKDALLAKDPILCLVRAGEPVYGEGMANPILGWHSPTYGMKIPALSISFTVKTSLPTILISEWHLPETQG